LVFHSSTITMMHGPINIRLRAYVCCRPSLACWEVCARFSWQHGWPELHKL